MQKFNQMLQKLTEYYFGFMWNFHDFYKFNIVGTNTLKCEEEDKEF